MHERIERVKTHINENRKVYITGVTCLVAGAAGGAVAFRSSTMTNIRAIQMLNYKSNQTIEVFIEALGDPGNIIQDTTTGTVYASQGQAARDLGVSAAAISQQLSGKKPHVRGHTFKVLGKAIVPENSQVLHTL